MSKLPHYRLYVIHLLPQLRYGNFDIVLDHFSRIFLKLYTTPHHATPHAMCALLYLVAMLIGC